MFKKALVSLALAAVACCTAATPDESFHVCKDTFEGTLSTVAASEDANGTATCLALDDLARCIGEVQAQLADVVRSDFFFSSSCIVLLQEAPCSCRTSRGGGGGEGGDLARHFEANHSLHDVPPPSPLRLVLRDTYL